MTTDRRRPVRSDTGRGRHETTETKRRLNRSQTMESSSVMMNVTTVESLRFSAKTNTGMEIISEPSPRLGGDGVYPNPMEYFIAALGTCAAIKTRIILSKMGNMCESVAIDIIGTRRPVPPEIFEKIHLSFTLSGTLDEQTVTEVIKEVLTLQCPVAVMVGKVAEITWDHRIV